MSPGMSQMTHSILILRYEEIHILISKKLSRNSVKDIVKIREQSRQSRCQSFESQRYKEKI